MLLIYLSKSTPVSIALSRLFNKHPWETGGYYPGSVEDIYSIISYVKPVKENIKNGVALTRSPPSPAPAPAPPPPKEFYQENEWRYVPKSPNIRKWISNEEYSNPAALKQFDEIAKNHGTLSITPNDIKYIFVKSDADIPEIIDFIQVNLKHFTVHDMNILISRVISSESINADL